MLLLTHPIGFVLLRSGYNMYYKALLANSATSALRLHQRLPQVQLSREFLGKVFLEDSAHYLLYSMIFFYSPPVTCKLIHLIKIIRIVIITGTYLLFQGCYCLFSFLLSSTFLAIL